MTSDDKDQDKVPPLEDDVESIYEDEEETTKRPGKRRAMRWTGS